MHAWKNYCFLLFQTLRRYGTEWIVEIKDVTAFVQQQYEHIKKNQIDQLMVAKELIYPVTNLDTAAQIGVDQWATLFTVNY